MKIDYASSFGFTHSYAIFSLQTKHTHARTHRLSRTNVPFDILRHLSCTSEVMSSLAAPGSKMACHAHVSVFGISFYSSRPTFSLISSQDDSPEIAQHSMSFKQFIIGINQPDSLAINTLPAILSQLNSNAPPVAHKPSKHELNTSVL